MPAAAVVTIIAAVVVVIVLAVFLLSTIRVLSGVSKQLDAVVSAVGTIATRTEPVNGVVQSINSNLRSSREFLTSLLVSKVGRDGAAELVASVDPLSEAPPAEEATVRPASTGYVEDEPVQPEGETIQYGRGPAAAPSIYTEPEPATDQYVDEEEPIRPVRGPATFAATAAPWAAEPEPAVEEYEDEPIQYARGPATEVGGPWATAEPAYEYADEPATDDYVDEDEPIRPVSGPVIAPGPPPPAAAEPATDAAAQAPAPATDDYVDEDEPIRPATGPVIAPEPPPPPPPPPPPEPATEAPEPAAEEPEEEEPIEHAPEPVSADGGPIRHTRGRVVAPGEEPPPPERVHRPPPGGGGGTIRLREP